MVGEEQEVQERREEDEGGIGKGRSQALRHHEEGPLRDEEEAAHLLHIGLKLLHLVMWLMLKKCWNISMLIQIGLN